MEFDELAPQIVVQFDANLRAFTFEDLNVNVWQQIGSGVHVKFTPTTADDGTPFLYEKYRLVVGNWTPYYHLFVWRNDGLSMVDFGYHYDMAAVNVILSLLP